MQDRQRQHAVLGVAEEAADARRADLAGLQVEQARDHLQVVLHAMMDLAQHVVALLEARPAAPASRLAIAAAIAPHALADRRHFRRPGLLRLERDARRRARPGRRSPGCSAAAARTSGPRRARPPATRRPAPARSGRTRPSRPAARAMPSATGAARDDEDRVVGQRQQRGNRRLHRSGRSRGMPSGRRRSPRRAATATGKAASPRDAAQRAAGAIDQATPRSGRLRRCRDTCSAKARSEMPRAHMPRNSPSCRIGTPIGITALRRHAAGELGAHRELARLAHQPEDLAIRETHADGRGRAGSSGPCPRHR